MPSIIELKNQIAGIKNTRKITKAVQLVAASKMKQFQERAVNVRMFAFDLLRILSRNRAHLQNIPLLSGLPGSKTAFVLYSSDRGLCGPLNQQLFKHLIRSEEWKSVPAQDRLLITIGRKGADLARVNQLDVTLKVGDVREDMQIYDTLDVVDELLEFQKQYGASKMYMVTTHYKNSFTYIPVVEQFLPLSESALEVHLGVHPELRQAADEVSVTDELVYFEPDPEELTIALADQLIRAIFMQAFYELKASEFSSRMLAMQSATDAASKILDEKTLVFNKIRQQKITQEIAEITGARAAIK